MRVAVLLCALALVACGGEAITVGTHAAPAGPRPIPVPMPAAAVEEPDAGPTTLVLEDRDFVEAETNRDPFRSYADAFAARPSEGVIQFDVIMQDTPVDDLGLIAIISGVANPSAMLTDAAGVGHTVHRGDHVARPEVVTAGGEEGLSVTLVWRVDRIRAGEVVLTRDDPSTPDRPPLTRTLVLHPEDDAISGGVTAL